MLNVAPASAGADGPPSPSPSPCGLVEARAAAAEGAPIGAIRLDRRQIFDTSLPAEDKPLYRLANRYHVLTRESTIRSVLLLRPGDRYSARLAAESERLLRAQSYLYEADIRPVVTPGDEIDVCVTTRDVWTLKPDFEFERAGGENELFVEIEDQNLLGTGATLRLSYGSDTQRDSRSLVFADPQIGRSRVAASVEVADNSDGHRRALAVGRPFFALDTRFAVGARLLDDERATPLYALGEEALRFSHRQRRFEFSAGRSKGLINGWTRRFSAGFVIDDNAFAPPADGRLAGAVPADRDLVYPFVAFEAVEDRFVEAVNQNQIGRTEDLHLGLRLTASLGYAARGLGADREAVVFASSASTGFGKPDADLLLLDSRLEGRYEDELRNTELRARLRWYRRQSERRLFYARMTGVLGERRDLDNPVVLGGISGMRGYPLGYQNGDSSVVVSLEQRYFTDWYPLRLVRVGAAIFADVGRVWGRDAFGTPGLGWLRDVGFGLRLASTRSGSGKILHIDLAFPLDGDRSLDDVQLLIEGQRGF